MSFRNFLVTFYNAQVYERIRGRDGKGGKKKKRKRHCDSAFGSPDYVIIRFQSSSDPHNAKSEATYQGFQRPLLQSIMPSLSLVLGPPACDSSPSCQHREHAELEQYRGSMMFYPALRSVSLFEVLWSSVYLPKRRTRKKKQGRAIHKQNVKADWAKSVNMSL